MKPSTYETLDTGDLELEAHVALLLARMARDLHAMYEPPDLRTPQAAAHSTAMADRLIAVLESYHRIIKALRSLEERGWW